jgi:hypothetical protein
MTLPIHKLSFETGERLAVDRILAQGLTFSCCKRMTHLLTQLGRSMHYLVRSLHLDDKGAGVVSAHGLLHPNRLEESAMCKKRVYGAGARQERFGPQVRPEALAIGIVANEAAVCCHAALHAIHQFAHSAHVRVRALEYAEAAAEKS